VSPPDSTKAKKSRSAIAGSKPKSDIYTVMLIVAAVALLFGILFLFLELMDYGNDIRATGAQVRIDPIPAHQMQPIV
jgi:hypothetical protein